MGKMRARITPVKADVQRTNERCWQTICEAQATSNAVMMIAVKRHFGLGAKRIAELVETFDKVKKEFSVYENDGILIKKISDELQDVLIDQSQA